MPSASKDAQHLGVAVHGGEHVLLEPVHHAADVVEIGARGLGHALQRAQRLDRDAGLDRERAQVVERFGRARIMSANSRTPSATPTAPSAFFAMSAAPLMPCMVLVTVRSPSACPSAGARRWRPSRRSAARRPSAPPSSRARVFSSARRGAERHLLEIRHHRLIGAEREVLAPLGELAARDAREELRYGAAEVSGEEEVEAPPNIAP
jgi:hypothetical protein